jgi:phage terminase Nu1 subunit (DNA packaging protein)
MSENDTQLSKIMATVEVGLVTQVQASKALGVPRSTIQQWAKDGCPFVSKKGVDIQGLASWARSAGRSISGRDASADDDYDPVSDEVAAGAAMDSERDSADIEVHRKRLIKAQADRVELDVQRRNGSLVDRMEVDRSVSGLISFIFVELDRIFIGELPAIVKGCDEISAKHKCEEAIESLKRAITKRCNEQIS